MMRFDRREVSHPGVTSSVGLGAKPRHEDFLGKIIGECAMGKAQHVGVVPHPGTLGLPGIAAQRRADAGDLIGRDADTGSGPTEEHALIAISARDGFGGGFHSQRPRSLATLRDRSEGHDLVAVFVKPVPHGGMHRVGLVGAEGNPHPTSVVTARPGMDPRTPGLPAQIVGSLSRC